MRSVKSIQEFANFEEAIQRSQIDPRCVHQVLRKLPKIIEEYESRPAHRIGRRVKNPVRKAVRRTLKHLKTAVTNSFDASLSRNEARELIRFVSHCTEFSELEARAKFFLGRHRKNVSRSRERREVTQAMHIDVSDRVNLIKVNTPRRLRSIGRTLNNCISDGSSYYIDYLIDGDSEFWEVSIENNTAGLIQVSCETREVESAGGPKNDPIELPGEVLLEIQRRLRISGHDVSDWNDRGAFHLFVEHPNLQSVSRSVGDRSFEVWTHENELILKENPDNWSRWQVTPAWSDKPTLKAIDGDLDIGEFLYLMMSPSDLRTHIANWISTVSHDEEDDVAEYDDMEAGVVPAKPRRRRRAR